MRQSKKNQGSALCTPDVEESGKSERRILAYKTSKSRQFLTVLILSPNPLLRTFLHEILAFHGYQSEDVRGHHDVFGEIIPQAGQMVFLDGVYLLGLESDEISDRVQKFIQSGVCVVVLADRRWDADFIRTLNSGGYQVLWKPLDYRQISQVMAQFGVEPRVV
ncbi:MAG: hypothetical protein OEY91_02275 [Nitrospirota bacterium]|nr:hypothetical protein [Nitrospirota bacterium]